MKIVYLIKCLWAKIIQKSKQKVYNSTNALIVDDNKFNLFASEMMLK